MDDKSTCRICDGPASTGTHTFVNRRPIHRLCLEDLCRLMPQWVPNLPREDA